MPNTPILGRAGVGSALTASYGRVFRADEGKMYFPHGGVIDGASRYYGGGTDLFLLPPGLLMGQVTATKKWRPSIIGVTTGALAGGGTSITLSAAQAVELVRRVGATGTFTLLGPTAANGTARQTTGVAYSAVDTTTGVVTITGQGTNQAEDVRLNPAATGGNIQLNVSKPDGTRVTTGNAAWSATDATFLGNINTALDTATGVVGGIVATAISATDPDLGFTLTYSGTGYAGLSWTPASVAVLPTSVTDWYVVPRTTAVSGAFAAGAWVQPADGSEIPRTVIDDGFGVAVPTDATDCDFPRIPTGGFLDTSKIINYPTDTGMIAWLKDKLASNGRGLWTFSDEFSAA
jgi:hypothetical protein